MVEMFVDILLCVLMEIVNVVLKVEVFLDIMSGRLSLLVWFLVIVR